MEVFGERVRDFDLNSEPWKLLNLLNRILSVDGLLKHPAMSFLKQIYGFADGADDFGWITQFVEEALNGTEKYFERI